MNKMENKLTPCECPIAGWCERHGINKSTHLHKLCQNHMGYFAMWEDCQGPNQSPVNCKKQSKTTKDTNFIAPAQHLQTDVSTENQKTENKLPSTMQMARNFIGAAAGHLANGLKTVDEEVQKNRLEICEQCPHMVEGSRCGKCGCFLPTKTKWASSTCPIGKW
jgi:hypothetical protein